MFWITGAVMKISQKRFKKLYDAIYNPIMDLRVKNKMGNVKDIDEELFVLENRIYKEVKEALELQKT
jgi:hypothetical protein